MTRLTRRWATLAILSSGLLLQSSCDAIADTIALAFSIVDVWV